MEWRRAPGLINNVFYNDLKERWHTASDHPIALLRAENALRNPWIEDLLRQTFPHPIKALDIGCGGGYLTNYLARKGHSVTGVDLSASSLETARSTDETESVEYIRASGYELPFPDESFHAVSAMNLLEHVEKPHLVIREAARVLKKGGFFFFHTFNRNFLSYAAVIKGVAWCFPSAPKNMHVYPLFIKPEELRDMCMQVHLEMREMRGIATDLRRSSFWKVVFKQEVDEDFRFHFTKSMKTGYSGFAKKV